MVGTEDIAMSGVDHHRGNVPLTIMTRKEKINKKVVMKNQLTNLQGDNECQKRKVVMERLQTFTLKDDTNF